MSERWPSDHTKDSSLDVDSILLAVLDDSLIVADWIRAEDVELLLAFSVLLLWPVEQGLDLGQKVPLILHDCRFCLIFVAHLELQLNHQEQQHSLPMHSDRGIALVPE